MSSFLVIFYVFSLIGNLGESLPFSSILYLSLLNSIQIFVYVPSIIILVILIIFMISLRSKNELVIIKEYFSTNKIIFAFIPLAIVFTFIEINKDFGSEKLEEIKINFLNSDSYIDNKIIIVHDKNIKSYTVLKGLNVSNSSIDEFQKYEVSSDSILNGIYVNDFDFKSNNLITDNYTLYKNNQFQKLRNQHILIHNFDKLSKDKLIMHEGLKKGFIKKDLFNKNKIAYYIVLYICIFLLLLNKSIIDIKKNLLIPILSGLILLFYSMLITSFELKIYHIEMQILALILVFLIFYKLYTYE